MASQGIQNTSTKRLLREREVRDRVGLSHSSLWRLRQAGRFPAPVAIGDAARGWLEHEINQWIDDRAAERDSA